MNLLFVARTGVYEALTVGLGYLDQEEQLENSSTFGNIDLEKKAELIYLGRAPDGQDGNEVYCVGNKYPDIVVRINEEIKSLIDNIAPPPKGDTRKCTGHGIHIYPVPFGHTAAARKLFRPPGQISNPAT